MNTVISTALYVVYSFFFFPAFVLAMVPTSVTYGMCKAVEFFAKEIFEAASPVWTPSDFYTITKTADRRTASETTKGKLK